MIEFRSHLDEILLIYIFFEFLFDIKRRFVGGAKCENSRLRAYFCCLSGEFSFIFSIIGARSRRDVTETEERMKKFIDMARK